MIMHDCVFDPLSRLGEQTVVNPEMIFRTSWRKTGLSHDLTFTEKYSTDAQAYIGRVGANVCVPGPLEIGAGGSEGREG
jgi:hypothetical protein